MKTTEKEKVIKELHEMYQFELSLLFEVKEIAKSVYYYCLERFKKPKKDIDIVESNKQICKESDYTYGYRRVTQALANKGMTVNHKKVRRIMKEHHLTCTKFKHKTRKYNSYRGTIGKVAKNILKRRFNTDRPYQKVVTDITEFKLRDGTKAYLSPFMD
ncbi:IS3 family transposase, partial [Staphylococcus felis]|uniref:IS3 family transposase n=1 Tax=Staphylococcus felis TaxID=46127 RepID=UPI000E36A508